ncbi:MAG: hydrogenase maturation nickel metallochaperone HypA [Clostridium sp.]|uniref:Hydrogenase maturation factor HypA n=1 Tax=Clostridium pasteurianum BC1 TaxID=86416 RepID=R4KB69_CLOPA|nr:hydrogenase maturation nickel metallochaperone HypA [Clostridium pasteurianum]AGK96654.1 hydrogenase nickel insertion protein HypA [Clostridium pasteurianum BC1]AGK96875.1 hydrogenase nickel insertion protein HypA [Clostridium pasteurianum BC1]
MHEVSIMENTINIISEKAKENNLKNISKITIKIGELSGVMSDSLIFAFNSLSKGTIAEGAKFLIEKVDATAMCDDCGITFEIDHFNKLCPNCNKFSTNILSGYELYVNTIEGE